MSEQRVSDDVLATHVRNAEFLQRNGYQLSQADRLALDLSTSRARIAALEPLLTAVRAAHSMDMGDYYHVILEDWEAIEALAWSDEALAAVPFRRAALATTTEQDTTNV